MKRVAVSLLCAFLLAGMGGCLGQAQQLGRGGVQGVISGAGESQAELRRVLREVLLDDDTLQRVAARFVQGALAGAGEPENRARVAALTAALADELRGRGDAAVDSYLQRAGQQLEQTLDHVSAQALARADATIKALLHRDLVEVTEVIMRRNAEVLAQALARELEGTLGQSLQRTGGQMARSMVDEAAAGLRSEVARRATQDLLRAATREATHEVVGGLRDELRAGVATQSWMIAGIVALGALVLLFGGALWLLVHQYAMSARALAVVAQKINEHGGDRAALKQAIRGGAERNHVEPWLSGFLKRRGL